MPSGMFQATLAISAMFWMDWLRSGAPRTKNWPSAYSMSASAASSRCAAKARALSLILFRPSSRAPAPTAVVRLP